MTSTSTAVSAYLAAISNPSTEAAAALAPHLAEDATVVGIVGPGTSREAIVEAIGSATAPRLLAAAAWSEPESAGDRVVVEGTVPTGSPLGGMTVEIRLDASGKIVSVGQSILAAAPPTSTPIAITEEMTAIIDGALANGTPFIVSYVDSASAPHLSLRGTVQVFDERTLATWARDPNAGLPRAIEANPHVGLLYRDPKTRINYTFGGRARIVADAATRDQIFDHCPEVERNLDGRKRGVAIVIELDSVEGSGPNGRVSMRRA